MRIGDAVQNSIGTIGLAFDALGVLLLFFFTIDKKRSIIDGSPAITWVRSGDEQDPEFIAGKKEFRRCVTLMNCGFICLIVGFLLQVVAL